MLLTLAHVYKRSPLMMQLYSAALTVAVNILEMDLVPIYVYGLALRALDLLC